MEGGESNYIDGVRDVCSFIEYDSGENLLDDYELMLIARQSVIPNQSIIPINRWDR